MFLVEKLSRCTRRRRVKVSVFAGAEKGDGPDGIMGNLNTTPIAEGTGTVRNRGLRAWWSRNFMRGLDSEGSHQESGAAGDVVLKMLYKLASKNPLGGPG
jgi:hypothetical protein